MGLVWFRLDWTLEKENRKFPAAPGPYINPRRANSVANFPGHSNNHNKKKAQYASYSLTQPASHASSLKLRKPITDGN